MMVFYSCFEIARNGVKKLAQVDNLPAHLLENIMIPPEIPKGPMTEK